MSTGWALERFYSSRLDALTACVHEYNATPLRSEGRTDHQSGLDRDLNESRQRLVILASAGRNSARTA